MTVRSLLLAGSAMPVIYVVAFATGAALTPGFDPLTQAPSVLGGAGAPHPAVFNAGVVLAGVAGVLGAVGMVFAFAAIRRDLLLVLLGGLASLSLLMGSIGLGMAGLFPLPDPRHYGYGLATAAALTPLLGAFALMRAGRASGAVAALLVAFGAILALVLLEFGPLAAGLAMMASIALLCTEVWRRSRPVGLS